MPPLGSTYEANAPAPVVAREGHSALCLAVSGDDDDARLGSTFGKLPHLGSSAEAAVHVQDATSALPFALWL
eukprot:3515579-Amphidinium_carterae.1